MLGIWQEADAIPVFEHAWLFDHFTSLGPDPTGDCLEGWTLLAALAARTERIRVGIMVTGNTYRHPAVLANMATTVDIISNGRLDFGIGAGWNELEHESYGIPLYAPGERIRRIGRGVRGSAAALDRGSRELRRAILSTQGGDEQSQAGAAATSAITIGGQRRAD